MNPSFPSQFPAAHSFAQTNIQLINQLKYDYTSSEIDEVLRGYELACDLFSGIFRGSGKPFLAHAIGTASIVAALSAPTHMVNAALLHAAYTHGRFGSRNRGTSPLNRQRVRDAVGKQSEELVLRYTNLGWRGTAVIPRIVQDFANFSQFDRDVLRMRLANELEEYLDLGILYCEDANKRIQFSELYGRYMVDLAGKLGVEILGGWLSQAFEHAQREASDHNKTDLSELSSANSITQTDGFVSSSVHGKVQVHNVEKGGADQSRESICTDESIAQVFTRQASLHPEHIAVECLGKSVLYSELDAQTDRLAQSIVAQFGSGNDPIVTLSGHDEVLAVLALGIWKARKIWIPLDATHPAHRLSLIVQDTKSLCILCDDKLIQLARSVSKPGQTVRSLGDMDDPDSTRTSLQDVSPDDLACLIYTSGSTGRPKGVIHNHRNLVHLARRGANALELNSSDRLTLLPSCSQIAGITDLLRALLSGGTLLPFDVRGHSVKNLAQWLMRQRVSIYHSSPSLFRMLAENLSQTDIVPQVRAIHLGGEAVSEEDLEIFNRHFSSGCVLMNNLGCTEISGYCQNFIGHDFVSRKRAVPAGYAVEGVHVAVCDERGEEVPIGQSGEIVVTSPYLALGYWKRPTETQVSFSTSASCPKSRTYRTGDLGYMLPDGCLVYTGRGDGQVQIRGNRVDAAEIESVIGTHPSVQRVAVKVLHKQNDPIVAFVVPCDKGVLSVSALRKFIKTQLPAYMIPTVRIVDQLPVTANGKINYMLLGQDVTEPVTKAEEAHTPPRTATERSLARLWREFVSAEKISIEDDFFALGGDSLLVTRLVNRIETTFGIEASLHDIFQHPTLGELATVVAARSIGGANGRLSNLQQHTLLTTLSEVETFSEAQSKQELEVLLSGTDSAFNAGHPRNLSK